MFYDKKKKKRASSVELLASLQRKAPLFWLFFRHTFHQSTNNLLLPFLKLIFPIENLLIQTTYEKTLNLYFTLIIQTAISQLRCKGNSSFWILQEGEGDNCLFITFFHYFKGCFYTCKQESFSSSPLAIPIVCPIFASCMELYCKLVWRKSVWDCCPALSSP